MMLSRQVQMAMGSVMTDDEVALFVSLVSVVLLIMLFIFAVVLLKK
jgi:hypothetical protein